MEALKRKIETGELTTVIAAGQPEVIAANTQRYFAHHEHKKQAKMLVARDFLRNEAPDLLELFDNKMSNNNGRKCSVFKLRQTPVTDSGFGKTTKARTSSAVTASHPYSRLSPAALSPLSDSQRRSVAACRILGEIDRGEVITPCDAFESLQEGLGLPRAIVNCSQLGNRLFNVTVDDGNRIYGQAQHALKPQAKLLAYEDAIRSAAPEIWSKLRVNEYASYQCSIRQFQSNEDVLHEYICRNFRTSVAFNAVGKNERNEIVMQAKVFGIVIGTGCNTSLKTAQSDAIDYAISDLCPHLMSLLTPLDPRLYTAFEADGRSYVPSSPSSQPVYAPAPEPFIAVPPERTRTGTPPLSDIHPSHLPTPPALSTINHGFQMQFSNQYPRERLIKPMDFGAPVSPAVSPAVLNLMERIEQGSITTLSALFAAYLQLVERTTAVFDVKSQHDGSFRCDITINGRSMGFGESTIKKQSKIVAIRNVMQALCPALMEQFTLRYPQLIHE